MNGPECRNYYETLGISPGADREAIQVMYRFLAKRYHPDNAQTGDGQRFQRIRRAYQVLCDPERRSAADSSHPTPGQDREQRWVEAKAPVRVEQDEYLRKALLWSLYVCRRENVDGPGVGSLHLECDLGCSEGELEFHLWYLKEKGWVERTENGGYAITADGVDKVAEGVVLRADRLLPELASEYAERDGRAPFQITDNTADRGEQRLRHVQ